MTDSGRPNPHTKKLFLEFKEDTFYLEKLMPKEISAESSIEDGKMSFSNATVTKLVGTRRIGRWNLKGDSIIMNVEKFQSYDFPHLIIDSFDTKQFHIQRNGEGFLMQYKKTIIKFNERPKDYWGNYVQFPTKANN